MQGHKPLDDQYLNIDQLSAYIKRSKGAIRNLILRRKIPFRKPGGRLIFLRSEIDQWIQMAPGQSLNEIFEKDLTK
jgi:excisionase family DNA binding protein